MADSSGAEPEHESTERRRIPWQLGLAMALTLVITSIPLIWLMFNRPETHQVMRECRSIETCEPFPAHDTVCDESGADRVAYVTVVVIERWSVTTVLDDLGTRTVSGARTDSTTETRTCP